MIGMLIFLTGLMWIAFMLLTPNWLSLAGFLPLGVYLIFHFNPAYWWLLILPAFPLLTLDIQILEEEMKFHGVWRYLIWLPSVLLFAMYSFFFFRLHFGGSWIGKAWGYVFGSFVMIVLGKLWIGDALLLLINRFKINYELSVTYDMVQLLAEKSGRSVSFYLISRNKPKLEISGFVYWYLKLKGAQKGDRIHIRFKAGWLGVGFATGFPKLDKKQMA